MTSKQCHRSVERPPAVVEDMMLMSQLPLLFCLDWWSSALESFRHSCAPRHAACSDEDEGQLVIPEPIEAEGETVFA